MMNRLHECKRKSHVRRFLLMSIVQLSLIVMAVHWFMLSYQPTRATSVSGCIIEVLPSSAVVPNSSLRPRQKQQLQVTEKVELPSADEWATSLDGSTTYHVVFTTGCSSWQDWQAYTFFYHAYHSGQRGHITRIVSGCSPEAVDSLLSFHETNIKVLSPNFHVYFTPDFADLKGPERSFKYFNKPFGVLTWMEDILNYKSSSTGETLGDNPSDDHIVMLLDPDMIITRPLIHDYRNEQEDWKTLQLLNSASLEAQSKYNEEELMVVRHGNPMAQRYAFGKEWRTELDISKLFPPDSPIHTVTDEEDDMFYQVGPPYLLTAKDMYAQVQQWTKVVVPAYEQNSHFLVEMFSYSLAAAHLELQHMTSNTFMVSSVHLDPVSDGEGWTFLDERFNDYEVCNVPSERQQHELVQPPRQPSFGDSIPISDYPHVLHYCQTYGLGEWFLNKYVLPTDFFSCSAPLLAEAPAIVASMYNQSKNPGGTFITYQHHRKVQRNAFMLCHLTRAFNDAASHWKMHNCPAVPSPSSSSLQGRTKVEANFQKTWIHHFDAKTSNTKGK